VARRLRYRPSVNPKRVVALVFVAALSLTAGSGCLPLGCDADIGDAPPPLEMTTSSVQATRSPATCNVVDPPFTGRDSFTLEIVGEKVGPAPYTSLTLTVPPTIALGEAFPLDVLTDSAAAQSASLGSPSIQFAYAPGSTPLDATTLDAVVVTVTAMPTADGQPLGATVQLYFQDGAELDQPFSAPVVSAITLCTTPAATTPPAAS
jgi:hypothetical protein